MSVVYATGSATIPHLRRIFDNRFSVYLGKISYALYLVHGPILNMLGFWLVPYLWQMTGKETMVGKETGFLLAAVIVTPLVVWAADIFAKEVDVRCVKLAKWVESLVSAR